MNDKYNPRAFSMRSKAVISKVFGKGGISRVATAAKNAKEAISKWRENIYGKNKGTVNLADASGKDSGNADAEKASIASEDLTMKSKRSRKSQ
jgi:hypothetical protein